MNAFGFQNALKYIRKVYIFFLMIFFFFGKNSEFFEVVKEKKKTRPKIFVIFRLVGKGQTYIFFPWPKWEQPVKLRVAASVLEGLYFENFDKLPRKGVEHSIT